MLALVIAEGVALLLLGVLVAGLLRSHAEILKALHDLGAGVEPDHPHNDARRTTATARGGSADALAHDVVGTDLSGAAAAVAVTGTSHDTLLAFLSSGCSTCQPFWSALSAGVEVPGGARLVVVVQEAEIEARLRELAGGRLDVITSDAAWEAYEVPGSPHFVYVHGASSRVVGEGTASDWPAVRDLMSQATADRRARTEARVPQDVEWRDNPTRIDAELVAAGIGPGHPSLVEAPEATEPSS